MKALRLKSLKHDPSSFISRYESEVNQPLEFWLDRLRDARAIHLVLTRDDPTTRSTDENWAILRNEWVGFVVIIAPDHQDVDEARSPQWHMAALYINPEVRGRGLGKRLVQTVIDMVKNDPSMVDGGSPYCLTSVRHGNDNALELYQRLGFVIIDPKEEIEKEGRTYFATTLRIDV